MCKLYSIHYTLRYNKILKKLPSDKINGRKNTLFFLRQLITRFLNLRSLNELKHKVRLSKTVCGIFHFWFRFVFIIFCSTKCMDSLTLKRRNSFQNQNNRKSTISFAPRRPIFKFQQEVLKFNDIYESWSSPKLT